MSPRSKKILAGFTLVESLVVVAIFSTTMLIAFDLFFGVNKVEKKNIITLKLVADARFAVEAIARDLRAGYIDFPHSAYQNDIPPADQPADTLVVKDFEGNRTLYKKAKDGSGDPCTADQCVLCVSLGATTTCDPVTPKGINVRTFAVYVTPTSDPYFRPRQDSDCRVAFNESDGVCTCADQDEADCWDGQTCRGPLLGGGICENPTRPTLTTVLLTTEGSGPCDGGTCSISMQTTISARDYTR